MSWAAVAKSATAPAAYTSTPPPSAEERIAVVDTNAIISGLRLEHLADRYCTIPEVVAEVRDKQSRTFLSTLPFSLDVREPSDESIKAVQRFARETGDIHSLSAVDLKLLALAHTLEVAVHGTSHLREHPVQVRTFEKHKSRPRALPGWGRVSNPEDWKVVDEAPQEQLTNAPGRQSRIIAAVQSLSLGGQEQEVKLPSSQQLPPPQQQQLPPPSPQQQPSPPPQQEQFEGLQPPENPVLAQPLPQPQPPEDPVWALPLPQPQPPEDPVWALPLPQPQPPEDPVLALPLPQPGGDEDSEDDDDDDGSWETACKSRNAARRKQRKQRRRQAWLERQQQQQQILAASAFRGVFVPPSISSGLSGQETPAAENATAPSQLAEQPVPGTSSEKAENGFGAPTEDGGTAGEGNVEGCGDGGERLGGEGALGGGHEPEDDVEGSEGEEGEEEEEGEGEEEEEGEEEGEGEGAEEGEEEEGLDLVTDEEEEGQDHDGLSEVGTTATGLTDVTATATSTAPSVAGTNPKWRPNTSSNVFTITADFAMQNVMLQMGLRLVSRDGKYIHRVSRWALRCTACFFVTKEVGRLFCPRCGNMTMDKVEVSVGPNGAEFFGVTKKFILRGTRFSLPKPKSGRGARSNPVLREDVLLARTGALNGRRAGGGGGGGKAAASQLDPFAPEFGTETWHQATAAASGRGGARGGVPPGVLLSSWKNNPNEVKPQRKSRRK